MSERMNGEEIMEFLKNFKDSAYIDTVIENLILHGELYGVLEKIIDGTIDKKFLKNMFPLKAKSTDWDDFCVLLEVGVMDGSLEMSDIRPRRAK